MTTLALMYDAMSVSSSYRSYMQGIRAGLELRLRMKRTGMNLAGQFLWTDDELNACRELYPDREAIARRLPGRSAEAIRHKCNELGLTSVRIAWTAADVSRLRRLYPSATWNELLAAFPGRSETALRVAANIRGMRRARKPYKITGFPALDQLRARCFERGYTMADLDLYAQSKNYFRDSAWRKNWFSARIVARAIKAMGGHIKAEWDDDSDHT